MASFEEGDVIKVPSPTPIGRHGKSAGAGRVDEADGCRARASLGLDDYELRKSGLAGDVPVSDAMEAGLPAPSIIRTAKIATIEAVDASKLGQVSSSVLKKVLRRVALELGVSSARA
jgi:mRNA interferase MazF